MKKHKNFYLIAVVFIILWINFLLSPSSNVKAKEEPRWCPLCGMSLKMYHQTNNRLTLLDGTSYNVPVKRENKKILSIIKTAS